MVAQSTETGVFGNVDEGEFLDLVEILHSCAYHVVAADSMPEVCSPVVIVCPEVRAVFKVAVAVIDQDSGSAFAAMVTDVKVLRWIETEFIFAEIDCGPFIAVLNFDFDGIDKIVGLVRFMSAVISPHVQIDCSRRGHVQTYRKQTVGMNRRETDRFHIIFVKTREGSASPAVIVRQLDRICEQRGRCDK